MIPRDKWVLLKRSLRRRRRAFDVSSNHRASLRRMLGMFGDREQREAMGLKLLPISSMQAASAVVTVGGHSMAVVDVEQANAIEFLLTRSLWREMPLFSYIEFMIRAAESAYDADDLEFAYRISQVANARLKMHVFVKGEHPIFPRPMIPDGTLVEVLQGDVVLSFIAAHECGHLLHRQDIHGFSRLFDFIEEAYRQTSIEPSRHAPGGRVMRYFKPESVMKFRDGVYDGDASLGIKARQFMDAREQEQIAEAQADAVGALAATYAAIDAGVPVSYLFLVLHTVLDAAEYFTTLRRTVPALPRGTRSGAIPFRPTDLLVRKSALLSLIGAIRNGSIGVDESIASYWAELNDQQFAYWQELDDEGRLEQIALRPTVLARGGVHTGLQGELPPPLSKEEVVSGYGPLAGTVLFNLAHLSAPSSAFCIEETLDWRPDTGMDGVANGFGAALRDLADLSAKMPPERGGFGVKDVMRDGSDADFVEVLRSARSQVRRRKVDENWHGGFEALFGNL